MTARFDSLPIVLWNVFATCLLLAALVDVVRQPASVWEKPGHRWVAFIAIGLFSLIVKGAYIPVLPALWFIRRLRRPAEL